MNRRINPNFDKSRPQIKLIPAMLLMTGLLFIGGIDSIVSEAFRLIALNWGL